MENTKNIETIHGLKKEEQTKKRNFNKLNKATNSSGITLIALVVTIIILLILAAITIDTVIGKDGIITKAKEVSAKVEEAEAKDLEVINELNEWLISNTTSKIKFSYNNEKWTNENVIVTVSTTDTESILQTSTDGVTWGTDTEITFSSNGTIYARLLDSENSEQCIEQKKEKINIIDKEIPVVEVEATNTQNTVTINVTAKDTTSGIGKVIWYYKLTETDEYITEEAHVTEGTANTIISKTWENLENETPFKAYAEIYDVAGNKIQTVEIISFYINYYYSSDQGIKTFEPIDRFVSENGMDWNTWVTSYYEGGYSFTIDSGVFFENYPMVNGDFYLVYPSDQIQPGLVYQWSPAECVLPDTEILVSLEGNTIQAQNIKQGNSVVYYNFETGKEEIGKISKVYVHEKATSFVKYTFDDGTYIQVTDYHPIYTKYGWKSYTNRNGYELPQIGDEVKTLSSWKKLTNIEAWTGEQDCYDFEIVGINGTKINNYFGNGTLVQGSYILED